MAKKPPTTLAVETLVHDEENIPTAEYQSVLRSDERAVRVKSP